MFSLLYIVMARLVRAIHFPLAAGKLDRPDKPGDDERKEGNA